MFAPLEAVICGILTALVIKTRLHILIKFILICLAWIIGILIGYYLNYYRNSHHINIYLTYIYFIRIYLWYNNRS